MALTDLVKGAGRVVQAVALGLAVYGCGGSDKSKEPTYEGMCQDFRDHLVSLQCHSELFVKVSDDSNYNETYQDCLKDCEPTVNYLHQCAKTYCELEFGNCGEKYCSTSYQECLQSFDDKEATLFCENSGGMLGHIPDDFE